MAENDNKGIFSSFEIDAIGELMNISLGSSATAVSSLLDRRVVITTPRVRVISIEEFEFKDLQPAVAVEVTYVEGLDGKNVMVLKKNDVRKILEILMMMEIPEEEFTLDEMSLSAISELMNQMMGSSATTMSDIMNETVNISVPMTFEIDSPDDFKQKYFDAESPMVIVSFDIEIEDCLKSEFISLLTVGLVKRMIEAFGVTNDLADVDLSKMEKPTPEEGSPISPSAAVASPQPAPAAPQPASVPAPEAAPQPVQAQGMQYAPPQQQPAQQYYTQGPNVINVQNMGSQFNNVTRLSKAEEGNLDLIMSVPLQVSVEIGRTKKQVKDILALSQGSLVVLDKLAGEQVDVFVNGQHVAKGDVVVVDDNFGVRLTEIIKNPFQLLQNE